MPNLHKKKHRYYAEFYDPDRHPRRKWVSLRTKDKQVARQKLTSLERQYARGEWDPWADAVPTTGTLLSEAIERFMAGRTDKSPATQRADRSTLGLLIDTLPATARLDQIERRHVDRVIHPKLSDASRWTYYARFHTFFVWCRSQGLMKRDPIAKMTPPKVGKRDKPFLSREDYEELLRTIEADAVLKESGVLKQTSLKPGAVRWLADVIRFAVGTGFRLSEICHLRWSAVDLKHDFVSARNTGTARTKSGHDRSVPFGTEVRQVLERLQDERTSEADGYVFTGTDSGTRLERVYVSKRFKHYVREAGLSEDLTFHALRHTYGSWLAMNGVSLFKIKELMGHADISTTMVYAHLQPQNLKEAVLEVFG